MISTFLHAYSTISESVPGSESDKGDPGTYKLHTSRDKDGRSTGYHLHQFDENGDAEHIGSFTHEDEAVKALRKHRQRKDKEEWEKSKKEKSEEEKNGGKDSKEKPAAKPTPKDTSKKETAAPAAPMQPVKAAGGGSAPPANSGGSSQQFASPSPNQKPPVGQVVQNGVKKHRRRKVEGFENGPGWMIQAFQEQYQSALQG